MKKYMPTEIESKWQKKWMDNGTFASDLTGDNKYYVLAEFPYPSGDLHMGHWFTWGGADIFARFKRMQGYDVFFPIGYDAFGLPAENAAIKRNIHPKDWTLKNIENMTKQFQTMGTMLNNWDDVVVTCLPEYYRWNQWIFLKFWEKGLAYRGKALSNWCPSCQTVLANENIEMGKCWRCGTEVVQKEVEQWFLKITDYADRLLWKTNPQGLKSEPANPEGLQKANGVDWPKQVQVGQNNWIGKKVGINMDYPVKNSKEVVTCFTTAPVNFGMTFIVLAPEHQVVKKILDGTLRVSREQKQAVKKYVDGVLAKPLAQRISEAKEKTGVFTGLYAQNRIAGWDVPVWIADFVMSEVGTGAVQGCPGHDYRDFEFAKKFGLPIIRVVKGPDGNTSPIEKPEQVIVRGMKGTMVNSKFLNGLPFDQGLEKTMDYAEEKRWGKRVVSYHLRDWLISRQRYWGPPIPMIYCDTCADSGRGERSDMPGWYCQPENELPVVLPRIEDYKPGDDGVAPLAKHKEFYETICPGCKRKAVRETDVSDTFLDSSWYFLRYPSTRSSRSGQMPFDEKITKKWLPVAMYTGGAEHSVLHLMYSRFITMALKDWGYIEFEEPITRFYAHGLVIKNGAKMSKSKGNVVNPDEYIALYGADALRLYLMFMGPFDQGGDFRDSAMEGMHRWVNRIWRMDTNGKPTAAIHILIKKVSDDIEKRR